MGQLQGISDVGYPYRDQGPSGRSYGGVDVPFVSFGPGRSLTVDTRELQGLSKSGFNRKEMPSNTFIQATYMVNNWKKNNTSAQLVAGMLYFVAKKTNSMKVSNRAFCLNTIVSIGHLNSILWMAWTNVQRKSRDGDPKAVAFLDILRRVDEDTFNQYARYRRNPGPASQKEVERTRSLLEDIETDRQDLRKLYSLCEEHDDFALCATPQLVLDRFKFGGVVLNYSTDSSVQGPGVFEHMDHYQILNGIVSGLAEVHDVFTPSSEMHVGSKLFLHVYRRPTGHLEPPYGAFCVDPLCMGTNSRPNILGTYRDMSGALCNGLLEEIGDVHYNKNREDTVPTQKRASGMDPATDLERVRSCTLMLAKITITLNKRKQ
jgi:hypothetical protein